MMARRAKRTIASALILSCAFLLAGCAPVPPEWVAWGAADERVDLDGDGTDEALALDSETHELSVLENGEQCAVSEEGWLVSDAAVGDLDSDGQPEIVALMWRASDYGPSKPFWDENDTSRFTQHVAIWNYADGALRQKWVSSGLGMEVADMHLRPDGRLVLTERDGAVTTWEWASWGLSLVDYELKLIAVGDNLAHESVIEEARANAAAEGDDGYDFSPIYEEASDVLESYDVAVVNQETPLVVSPADYGGFPSFGTPQEMGDALADAGFDVVLCANNHAGDRGEHGVAETLAYWQENHPEVAVFGIRESGDEAASDALSSAILERNGIALALFDYTDPALGGTALPAASPYRVDTLDDAGLATLLSDVDAAEDAADFTICFLHIGEEYSTEPSARQRDIAARLVAAGADAVICTHPHVVQPVEDIEANNGNRGVVFYSLGNFMSHQTEPGTETGAAASLTIRKASDGTVTLSECSLIPARCEITAAGTRTRIMPAEAEQAGGFGKG